MPLNVKNEETHRMARELAKLTGRSITDAVTEAVRVALAQARLGRGAAQERRTRELDEIATHCASLPMLDTRTAGEILGYDDNGLPH